jgi:hypothetical protein
MVAYGYFLVYVFLIVVVLMNLLNGLAVSDTGDIKVSSPLLQHLFQYFFSVHDGFTSILTILKGSDVDSCQVKILDKF